MKIYCTERKTGIDAIIGKDIWAQANLIGVETSNRNSRNYKYTTWIQILSQTPKFYRLKYIGPYDRGDYIYLKLNTNEVVKNISKDKVFLIEPIEYVTPQELPDILLHEAQQNVLPYNPLENPEGYSLGKRPNGDYYWHYDGERNDNFIVYDMPITAWWG